MYPGGQRHVSNNDPTRPFQVPPPPPISSPPMNGPQMGSIMNVPPPPPRYPAPPGTAPGVMIPPPPGPPPGSALAQQQQQQQPTWHGNYGRMYDGRGGFNLPPPPPTPGQHQPYNPKIHAQMAARHQAMAMPPPPPPSDAMSATYIPSANSYGEGVGIPGFGGEDHLPSDSSQGLTMPDNGTATGLEDPSVRGQQYMFSSAQARGLASGSGQAGAGIISPEMAEQWPLDTVLIWLAQNMFSREWQETFRALHLCGQQFLELGNPHGLRGNHSMMHQQVYPQLARECTHNGVPWNQPAEREEGKRMRRLIRSIVTGKPVEPSKSHGRQDSTNSGQSATIPSAGTDPSDSPNVRIVSTALKLIPLY